MNQLKIRCSLLQKLFNNLMKTNSKIDKELLVKEFREKYPKMEKDLNFCFEVLAGKHKVGYTAYKTSTPHTAKDIGFKTIKEFYNNIIKTIKTNEVGIHTCMCLIPENLQDFFVSLTNRDFKLGYSNKKAMITNLSPMLAKKYPESHREQFYYIQEKLDGNRCIAYYDKKWKFQSRSGKPLTVKFDMEWAMTSRVYDGEIMTLGKAGSRDFNKTSGAVNSKFVDKSELHYYIYDIMDDTLSYKERYKILEKIVDGAGSRQINKDCSILPVLDEVWVYPNPEYNYKLDYWLDYIVSKGGEGIMLRDPDALYKHGEPRTNALLKYKKLQTMDLRIVNWNLGKGKYMGAIGSFHCESDDGKISVNVAGMDDATRFSDPQSFIGKIIEVAYFDCSKSKTKTTESLRFPRLKRIRYDKDTTSIY